MANSSSDEANKKFLLGLHLGYKNDEWLHLGHKNDESHFSV